MKVLHISHADGGGGAAIAALRIHKACLKVGIESQLWVNVKTTDEPSVQGRVPYWRLMSVIIPGAIRWLLTKVFVTNNPVLHSPSLVGTNLVQHINSSDADVVNIHWVQWETLSIRDISKIKKPIVWTCHDMWPYCGAEHYSLDERYREGYKRLNRPQHEGRIDLNRLIWRLKLRYFKDSFYYVGNSEWTTNNIRASKLCGNSRVSTIGIPLNMVQWRAIDKKIAKSLIGAKKESIVICFGAIGGVNDERKGGKELKAALSSVMSMGIPNIELHLFGASSFDIFDESDLSIVCHGRLVDSLAMQIIYSASDLMIVPSLQEAFGQTALEASACGTPVLAFDVGGLRDIIVDGISGKLISELSSSAMADGIVELLTKADLAAMGRAARDVVKNRFDEERVGNQYFDVYKLATSNEVVSPC